MDTDDQVLKDIAGNILNKNDIIALAVENKQKIGIIDDIKWNKIEFRGEVRFYPTITVLVGSVRWINRLQRIGGYLRKYKISTSKNIVKLAPHHITNLIDVANTEPQKDIFMQIKQTLDKA